MSTLPKPQMRGLLASHLKKHLAIMIVVATSGALMYKIFICDRRKKTYADFYKTYDPEKQLKIMNEAGLMQSYIVDKK